MASSSKPKKIYNVFLSFRGMDLRNNFIGHLYQALHQNGIYTFRDSEELRKGDQISTALMKAIEESRIAIIIFSKDYASSPWCLEELTKIMECKEQRDLIVFSVFYKVEPREVRTPRGSYNDALVKHESQFMMDSEKVKRWKKALFDAGCSSGWHLNDGDEWELIQRIVKEISTHLNRTPLYVAKHPVGIDAQVVKLKSMLNVDFDDDVVMVGLWGPGGIGKTTLVKALYNATVSQFEGSCFLANVRETSQGCMGLVTLQEKLLKDALLLQQRLELSNVDKGINIIQHRLCCKKVLLILDDVDDLSQLNALAGEGNWFGDGSRIIVTTRDKRMLHGLDHIYEVKALNASESRELLSHHAFPTHQKLEIRTDLVNSVLKHAGGLPLALELLGSFLRDRGEREWKSTLKKLSRIPDKTINDVLKISYDGLEENEKEIFLHIACFFKGRTREYTKKVLDNCDLETAVGFDILIKRSLISIEFGILKMHDLIQAMGVDKVHRECRDDPRRRSRLWLYDDVVDVLSHEMGDCAVKAIVLELPEPIEMCIYPNAFTKMRRLRLLILRNVHNSFQGPICLPNELGWFEWPGCAHQIPEFSFGPKKIVGLNMSGGNITRVVKQFKDCTTLIGFPKYEDPANLSMKTGFPSLQYLNLQGCNLFEVEFLENLSSFPVLRRLNLSRNNITNLPTSINKRDHLSLLNVGDCYQLQEIPELPPYLNYFWADNCKSLQKTGDLISSREIALKGLSMIQKYTIDCYSFICLPGGEMPEWFVPVEEGLVSFRASKDLYNKFLGLAFCVVLSNNEQKEQQSCFIKPYVNGQRQGDIEWMLNSFDSDHLWLQFHTPYLFFRAIDFGPIDGSYKQFGLEVSCEKLKKWGFRIICKQLEDNLKVMVQHNQLMDPALLYEIGHDSTNSETESSSMHEDTLREIDCHTEEHNQIGSKRNHEFILPQGKRVKMVLTSNSTDREENGEEAIRRQTSTSTNATFSIATAHLPSDTGEAPTNVRSPPANEGDEP
ncbi:TMV resistance protein N-like isoform X2 [Syzygium oleosum]|uniref:TMV resistance protein N-like isoform X2 n=1 Tax=Syzygium oleosum TaxID=219896 RepID=UPI0024B8BA7D|nr:TMV resistance protein N-like isoform X2 [Syzygium oleosum]